jgi:hypothetical protein
VGGSEGGEGAREKVDERKERGRRPTTNSYYLLFKFLFLFF